MYTFWFPIEDWNKVINLYKIPVFYVSILPFQWYENQITSYIDLNLYVPGAIRDKRQHHPSWDRVIIPELTCIYFGYGILICFSLDRFYCSISMIWESNYFAYWLKLAFNCSCQKQESLTSIIRLTDHTRVGLLYLLWKWYTDMFHIWCVFIQSCFIHLLWKWYTDMCHICPCLYPELVYCIFFEWYTSIFHIWLCLYLLMHSF